MTRNQIKLILMLTFFWQCSHAQNNYSMYSDTLYTDNEEIIQNTFLLGELEWQSSDVLIDCKVYYKNSGQLKSEFFHSKNSDIVGVKKDYFENGKISRYSEYIYGAISGVFIEFHSNGNVKTSGTYLEIDNINQVIYEMDTTIISNNQKLISGNKSTPKNGFWIEYDINGIEINKEFWSMGQKTIFKEK